MSIAWALDFGWDTALWKKLLTGQRTDVSIRKIHANDNDSQ